MLFGEYRAFIARSQKDLADHVFDVLKPSKELKQIQGLIKGEFEVLLSEFDAFERDVLQTTAPKSFGGCELGPKC